jgi:hypothetical protein
MSKKGRETTKKEKRKKETSEQPSIYSRQLIMGGDLFSRYH